MKKKTTVIKEEKETLQLMYSFVPEKKEFLSSIMLKIKLLSITVFSVYISWLHFYVWLRDTTTENQKLTLEKYDVKIMVT